MKTLSAHHIRHEPKYMTYDNLAGTRHPGDVS